MEIFLTIILPTTLSALSSWFITHRYYRKSLKIQENEHRQEVASLIQAIQQKNAYDSSLQKQQRIDAAVEAWKRQGTAEYYLNSLEIPNEEKAQIFRAACIRYKKRKPKRNPYIS
jgi:capsular polysaccharide biosynthesis protein